MDHKTWLWRKKSTEKTIVSTEKANKGNEEILVADKAELERDLKTVNDKLSSPISKCDSKNDLVKKNEKMAQEAIAGWERAEMDAISFKQELGKALEQKVAAEERLTQLDAALKECMLQLCYVREEQERRIHDAVTESSRDFEKKQMVLEANLEDSRKKLSKLGLENSHFSKALSEKEMLIEDLNECRTQAEADFNALTARLESLEKDNASLKYEVRVFEKELEIQNEEREFNRRTADAAHKIHVESMKKIAKLESECQRLRILVRKRLPGPAALAKMKNEVLLLGKNSASCSESWASALISELEHFKSGKQKETPSHKRASVSDIDLMDDFVEMEKLANVYVDAPSGSSDVSSGKSNAIIGPRETEFCGNLSGAEGKEIIPVSDHQSGLSVSNPQTQSKDILMGGLPGWLQNVLKVILEQYNVKQRNPDQILEDIRVALVYASNTVHDGSFSWRSPVKSSVMDSLNGETSVEIPSTEEDKQFRSDLNKSVSKMIDLIEGINFPSQNYNAQDSLPGKEVSFSPYKISETSTGYTVRVFQWKTSELSEILQQSVQACYDLLNGRVSLEIFIRELTSVFDWIMNHCFSLQDVPSRRHVIMKHFDSGSESEAESGMTSQFSETEKPRVTKEQSYLPPTAVMNVYNGLFQMEDLQLDTRGENKKLKDELMNMELAKRDLEERLHAAINQSESAMLELRESENRTASLQTKLEVQIEKHKLMNEDLDTQLKVTRTEQNEVRRMFSSIDLELTSKNKHCEELEATCVELQLQLESVMKKKVAKNDVDQAEKALRTDWEITTASERLAECQEAILNLGKQLKALASPREATLFNKVSSPMDTNTMTTTAITDTTPKNENTNRCSSLLDKMLAEDAALAEDFKYPMTIETVCMMTDQKSPDLLDGNLKSTFGSDAVKEAPELLPTVKDTKPIDDEAVVGSLAIVPSKKRRGWGFIKKLLWRKKKVRSKEMALPVAA